MNLIVTKLKLYELKFMTKLLFLLPDKEVIMSYN